jgi:membrane peptidoglycan carboxypeptidase
MNAYDDGSSASEGQRAPGGWPANGDGYGDTPGPRPMAPEARPGGGAPGAVPVPAAAKASVGRATVGRAAVPAPPAAPSSPAGARPGPGGGGGPNGRASGSSGHGSNGRAVNGHGSNGHAVNGHGANGHGSNGTANGDSGGIRTSGRASVGAASVGSAAVGAPPAGRATVGRAVVRPVSPAPGMAGPGGPGGVGPGGPGGPGRGGKGGKTPRSKRRKRINWLIAIFAVVIMLGGVGVVSLTWFYDTVKSPTDFGEPEATLIMAADGKQQVAKLGDQNRTLVPYDKISPTVKNAVMAAEDKAFLDHGGIDAKGIARAAWNNFTGGTRQGASTITQQYARHVAELDGITYARKLREAVLASKLEQEFTKDQILGYYLNAIYYGRGAHGIEAAAQTYFGKSALTQPGQKNALTIEEAAVLAAVIKQPEPDSSTGHKGFDPKDNLPEAQARWSYTLDNMVEKGWMSAADRAKAQYPKTIRKFNPKDCAVGCGADKPTGNVINYVRQELEAMGLTDWNKGGYKITTTINPGAQKAAENAARAASKTSPMHGLSSKYMAAMVAIDPSSGRVLAYYGGENGTGTDYAGLNTDDKTGKWFGGHPPGSSFKVYTLAAALKADISFDSHWDSTKTKDGPSKITNAGRSAACGKWCTLEDMTVQSFNVPFYWIAKNLGPDKVVEAARDAGVRVMWPDADDGPPIDLTTVEPSEVAPSKFYNQIGFGQYGITVLDHANGVATITNRGLYTKAHFVQTVEKKDPATGKWIKVGAEQLKQKQVFDKAKMDDLNGVLQKIPGSINNTIGRPATGKTGTWQLGQTKDNADAWMVGATPQIAAAVWVGGKNGNVALRANGESIAGANVPAAIWEEFMENAHKAMKLPEKGFPERKQTGDPETELATGVSPPPVAPTPNCPPMDLLCQFRNGGNNGGGNNGGGNNGGGRPDQPVIPPPAGVLPPGTEDD